MLRATRSAIFWVLVVVIFWLLLVPQGSRTQSAKRDLVSGSESAPAARGESRLAGPHSPQAEEYFREIALGSEWGGTRETPWRQREDLHIFVQGQMSSELEGELTRIVIELNSLIEPIEIKVVPTQAAANYVIFLGPWKDFWNSWPEVNGERLEHNWGYFQVRRGWGLMYVDTYRANIGEQKHLLREELTQSLGLFNDSPKYRESIFYAGWTTTTEYSDLDRELIQMLYNEGR